MVTFIRRRVLEGELMFGAGCVLGSSLTAEMAGKAGFDWLWLDLEHGAGDHESLAHQIQACCATPAAPIVRVRWNEPPLFKRVLDLGAAGVVVPYVSTPEEAEQAAAAMRFPPEGIRGMAGMNRATGFRTEFEEYVTRANDELLTVVQLETEEAIANASDIGAVTGVDVLFVGPLDLSVNMGIRGQWDDPRFLEHLERVGRVAREHSKAAGIVVPRPDMLDRLIEWGFTFLVLGSDGSFVAAGLQETLARVAPLKE